MKVRRLAPLTIAAALAAIASFSFTRKAERASFPLPIKSSAPQAIAEHRDRSDRDSWSSACAARLHGIAPERDPGQQSHLVDAFIDSLGKNDCAASLAELSALGSTPFMDEIRRRIVRQWSAENPRDAAKWAEALPSGQLRNALLEQIALGWCNRDAVEALAWAQQLPDGGARERIVQILGLELARTDPLAALDIAVGMKPGPPRDELCRHAAGQWAASDPHAAAAWAAGITDDHLRSAIVTTVVSVWASRDPRAAAEFVATGIEPGAGQSRLAALVAQRRAQQDAAAAAARTTAFAGEGLLAPQL